MSRPFVSVLTPTYNRVQFIPRLIECYKAQIYPKEFMEWIILDDGQELCKDIIEQASKEIPNIRYIQLEEKLNIGEKRNILNNEAKGEIIVCMDDDDYYPPERVSHAVASLKKSRCLIAGCSDIYMYEYFMGKLYKFKRFHPYHSTNNCMAFKREYLRNHKHAEGLKWAEETSFTNNFTEPMVQLDSQQCIIVSSHNMNTVNKRKFCLDSSNGIYPYLYEVNGHPITTYIPSEIFKRMSTIFTP